MFMRSASEAINNAPVICNHCFTQASEQDWNIMCYVFTFTLSPQCGENVWGLLDTAIMAVQYNNRLRGRTVMVLPASCPHSMVVTMGNCRHKVRVLDIPLSLGWSQMTGA